jgi:predicted nuclease of predicted toxin-antitoxin system
LRLTVDRLRFFLDAGVPDQVGAVLKASGHIVFYYRDALAEKQADSVVASTALLNEAVLVAHDRDMRAFPKRYGMSPRGGDRFPTLSLLHLCCAEVQAKHRIAQAMPLIELEWDFANQKTARRMWVEIGDHYLKTYR